MLLVVALDKPERLLKRVAGDSSTETLAAFSRTI